MDENKYIKASEKVSCDKRVKVYFQKKASCDDQLMKEWTHDECSNIFTNPPTSGSTGNILVAVVHRVQQTDPDKRLLQSKNTILVNVPGCTSRVQALDVVIKKPFKNPIKEIFQRHLDEKLDYYVCG